jgi:dienelactone hydrolase
MKIVLALCACAALAAAQNSASSSTLTKKIKTGLWPEDWKYTLAPGVTTKEITYYSDGIACFGKIFYPKDFSAQARTPGVVLGQGWAGTHFSIEKYAARFAEKGLVAMVIDYRGWGMSDGYPSIASPERVFGDHLRDDKRYEFVKGEVTVKRTRLLPLKQVEDYRNAISYLQGEPGVDPERIGVWGSSFAGGNSITVAGLDARVKAVAVQVPAVGSTTAAGSVPIARAARNSAIARLSSSASFAPCSFIRPLSSDFRMFSGDMRRIASGEGARVTAGLSWHIAQSAL